MYETFNTPFYLQRSIEVNYSSFTAEWQIKGKSSVSYNDVAAYTTYGTSRANAYKILEDSLNLRDVRIYDTIGSSSLSAFAALKWRLGRAFWTWPESHAPVSE